MKTFLAIGTMFHARTRFQTADLLPLSFCHDITQRTMIVASNDERKRFIRVVPLELLQGGSWSVA